MAEAEGGDVVSVGGAKVMAEGCYWAGRRKLPKNSWKAKVTAEAGSGDVASAGRWEVPKRRWKAKVTAEAGGAGLTSLDEIKVTAELGLPKGCDWLGVLRQRLRAEMIRKIREAESLDEAKVMAELGLPKGCGCDWREVLRERLRAEVIRKIKEAEGGEKVTAEAQAEAMAEVIRKLKEMGSAHLASVGGAKVTAEAGGGDLASVGGGNWVERRRVPQKYLKAKTCVIWDIEKRPFPDFCKPAGIARFIRSAVSYMGFGGEVDIIAVGDTRVFQNQIDLLRSGILVKFSDSLIYPPEDDDVLNEIFSWKEDNPSPGNILLISADSSLSAALRFISNDGYYIIRVREPDQKSTGYQAVGGAPDDWDWSDLQEAGPQQKGDWLDLQEAVQQPKGASLGGATTTWVGGNWASQNQVDEKFLREKTCVIWDIERRPLPDFCKPGEIARFIKSVVSHMGFVGKVDIIAVGDTRKIMPEVASDLVRSGIVFEHSDGGNTYPPGVLAEIKWWTARNLPPANIMLISGHCRFSDFLGIPSDEGYYIIRVRQESTGPHTSAYVLDSWDWSDLLGAGTKKCLPPMRGRNFKQQYTPSRGKWCR